MKYELHQIRSNIDKLAKHAEFSRCERLRKTELTYDVTPDIYRMGIQVSFTEATAESAMNRSVLMPLMLMTMLSYSCLPLSV